MLMRLKAFTLIELSIVLVIVGLIVGGILVGRDLIEAAGVRATIAQVDKYSQAVNTFKSKYGQLPGDMDAGTAVQFGFAGRGPYAGQGDGDGVIQGNCCNGAVGNYGNAYGAGETMMFWSDLTYANGMNIGLIDGSFKAASPTIVPNSITGSQVDLYFPQAKLGGGNYISVWSGGVFSGAYQTGNGYNYFELSVFSSINNLGRATQSANLPVRQAYNIDTKIDDGLPQSGRVQALYLNYTVYWSATSINSLAYTTATAGSSATCFDNNNVGGTVQQYSLGQSNGNRPNCTLAFKFQ